MHRLVAQDAGRNLREVAVAEHRHGVEVRAHRALLERSREAQHVGLALELLRREGIARLLRDRLAAQLLDRARHGRPRKHGGSEEAAAIRDKEGLSLVTRKDMVFSW